MTKEEKAAYDREYRRKNAERRRQQNAEWQRNNPEKTAAKKRRHYEKLRADPARYSALLEYNAAARRRPWYAKWYADNRDRLRVAHRLYMAQNRELYRLASTKHRTANRDRINAALRAARKTPEGRAKVAEYRRRRLARLMRASVGADLAAVVAFYRDTKLLPVVACHWCRKPVPVADRVVDHVMPLSKGGRHSVENLARSCFDCNARKHAKLPEHFQSLPA